MKSVLGLRVSTLAPHTPGVCGWLVMIGVTWVRVISNGHIATLLQGSDCACIYLLLPTVASSSFGTIFLHIDVSEDRAGKETKMQFG